MLSVSAHTGLWRYTAEDCSVSLLHEHTWYIHRQSFVQTHTTPHGCLYITYISNVHVLGCGQKCMQSHCCVSCLLSAVQERLTREIATAISEAVQPSGVAVVIEAT